MENWNWPDIADAFSQGNVASYIDAHGSAAVIANPEKSKVIGKIGFARWPKGPSGKRVTSIWNLGEYQSVLGSAGDNFIEAATTSFAEDTDVDWRPRLPQWPAVGDTMATAIQASLVGQSTVTDALNAAQAKIDTILKG